MGVLVIVLLFATIFAIATKFVAWRKSKIREK